MASENSTLKWLMEADLLELFRMEERDLIQKSKLNWMKLGDVNTKFFHRFLAAEKKRKEKSTIFAEKIAKYQFLKNCFPSCW